MEELIKALLIFLLGFMIGFGFWYLVIWFLTTESNLFTWHWGVKIIYIFLSFSATSASIKSLLEI